MSIEELLLVVEPPAQPIEAGTHSDFQTIEKKLGICLPPDYRDIGLCYGSGAFVDPGRMKVEVYNPFSAKYFEKVTSNSHFLQEMKNIEEEEVPYNIYPENPGLFLWGWDDNGWNLCWFTEGRPDQWPILVSNSRKIRFEKIDLSITSFLAGCFSRRINHFMWPLPFFSGPEKVKFIPNYYGFAPS
jgi:hypothetical protein